MQSPYEILGVRPSADADTLRTAYRRLAQRHHPDRNPGDPTANARFQAIQEAYAQARAALGRPRQASDDIWSAFENMFGDMMRNAREASTSVVDVQVPLESLLRDSTHTLAIGAAKAQITVPAGLPEGHIVPLSAPIGRTSHARVFTHPHPVFTRNGSNLESTIGLTLSQMLAGGRTILPTLEGPAPIVLPELSAPGTRMVFRGHGLPDAATGGRGDWTATVSLRIPESLSRQQVESLRAWEASAYAPPKAG